MRGKRSIYTASVAARTPILVATRELVSEHPQLPCLVHKPGRRAVLAVAHVGAVGDFAARALHHVARRRVASIRRDALLRLVELRCEAPHAPLVLGDLIRGRHVTTRGGGKAQREAPKGQRIGALGGRFAHGRHRNSQLRRHRCRPHARVGGGGHVVEHAHPGELARGERCLNGGGWWLHQRARGHLLLPKLCVEGGEAGTGKAESGRVLGCEPPPPHLRLERLMLELQRRRQ